MDELSITDHPVGIETLFGVLILPGSFPRGVSYPSWLHEALPTALRGTAHGIESPQHSFL